MPHVSSMVSRRCLTNIDVEGGTLVEVGVPGLSPQAVSEFTATGRLNLN